MLGSNLQMASPQALQLSKVLLALLEPLFPLVVLDFILEGQVQRVAQSEEEVPRAFIPLV